MSPASYLTAPPRVASTRIASLLVPWWTSLALGAFATVVVASAVFAAWALGRLRRLRATGETIATALHGLELDRAALERRAEDAAERAEDIQRARARLDRSLERLSVLTWALGEARRTVVRWRGAYLRK
jgi:hypothetical protein